MMWYRKRLLVFAKGLFYIKNSPVSSSYGA
nr:MAG TPA: hypothetical protein [Caudoviricetes sp.]